MEYSCFDGFLQRSWDELLHMSKFSNLYKSHVFFVFSYAKRMVNLMWRCIRGFLTANWIGPATFRRGYAMIRPLKFDIDTQHSHSWKGNTSFPNYYFQYSSEISRVYVLQLIYPRSTNHHFWNTKNAKRHEGESLLVMSLMVISNELKHITQIESPWQAWLKVNNVWNHHLLHFFTSWVMKNNTKNPAIYFRCMWWRNYILPLDPKTMNNEGFTPPTIYGS